MRYYLSEAQRLRQGAVISPELAQAQSLYAWLITRSEVWVHLATIYQLGPSSLREASAARKAMKILEDHGWVFSQPAMVLDGAKRKEVWSIRKGNS